MKLRQSLVVAALALALIGAWVLALRDRNAARAPEALARSSEAPPADLETAPRAAEATPEAAGGRSLDAPDSTIDPAGRVASDDRCAPGAQPAVAPSTAAIEAEALALDYAAARELLLVSQDAEHLAAAALLAETAADRVADVTKAMTTGRNNAAVVWTAVQICDRAGAHPACPAEEWEADLLRLDSGNSEAWMHVAVGRWRRGDAAKALEAVQRAGASAETRTYWADTVEMLERALASTGGYSFSTRVMSAFGLAATNLPDYTAYTKMCREQASLSPAWADACLAYGQLAERQDRTELGQSIAGAIQAAALQANGQNAAEAAASMSRAKARRAAYEVTARTADPMLVSTPAQFSTFLATLREHGELAALQLLSPGTRACEK